MRKNPKRILIWLAASGIVFGGIGYVSFRDSPQTRHFNAQLNAIPQQSENFLLKDLTNFDWTKVCIYCAYSRIDSNVLLKEGYTIIGNIPDLDDDGAWALLFLNEQQKVAYPIPVRALECTREKIERNCYAEGTKGKVVIEILGNRGPESTRLPVLILSD